MMKRLLASMCAVLPLFAYNHPCPNSWQVSGEFLYLLPTVDDTSYVIQSPVSTGFPNGTKINNDFSFSSGFRVGAEYSLCNPSREFQAFYTYLGTEQTKTVSGSFLWATLGRTDFTSNFENYTGSATAEQHLLYQRLDLTYAQRVLESVGLYLYLKPGVELAYLRYNEDFRYQITGSSLGQIQERSKVRGVGPELGWEFGYDFYTLAPAVSSTKNGGAKNGASSSLCDSATHVFSLSGMFATSLLASNDASREYNTVAGTTQLDVTNDSTWRVVPALHAQAGLNYYCYVDYVGVSLSVGYEFNSYIRGISRQSFPDDVADGLSSTNYYNFDVQGLYVSGSITF